MAWRPNQYLINGELDNTYLGRITGWMKFAGISEKITFELEGDFHRDIRGTKIRFSGDADAAVATEDARQYMQGFSSIQKGKAGDITAGRRPVDYVDYPYIEWYSENNGRVVIELNPEQIEVIGEPIPAVESYPVSRQKQTENMAEFLSGIVGAITSSDSNSSINRTKLTLKQKKAATRGMKLLTKELRDKLPPLYSQESKGGKAVCYLKLFTPDSQFSWYITEGSPIKDENGREVDFHMFGLVDGHCKELGYVSLKELQSVKGPLGLPVERDMYFKPKPLEEIAPQFFKKF